MVRSMMRVMTICAVLTAAVMLDGFHKAHAEGHWRGSHGGSWGSHGGSWGSQGGSWGSRGGSWGSQGGSWGSYGGSHGVLFPRIRHGVSHVLRPFAHRQHCYVYRGSWGSHGSHGSVGGAAYYYSPGPPAAPAEAGKNKNAQPGLLPGPAKGAAVIGDALLAVEVPGDAKIFVNGAETNSTGENREYISHGLTPGLNYSYEVRAEATRNGRTISETKIVQLHAGETTELSFALASDQAPNTILTLNVPQNAKVFLEGNETKGTGEVRVFTTTTLAAGKKWTDYQVRVIVQRDGRSMSQEEMIVLESGQSQTLTFDFNTAKIADAR